jgi:hypothetical protein
MQEEAMNPPKRRLRAAADNGQPVRDGNVDLITIMLEALEKEHEFLCVAVPCHATCQQSSCLVLRAHYEFSD